MVPECTEAQKPWHRDRGKFGVLETVDRGTVGPPPLYITLCLLEKYPSACGAKSALGSGFRTWEK